VFTGHLDDEQRQLKWDLWNWGVERSLGWVKQDLEDVQVNGDDRN
jgi:hypothetical protein